MAKNLTQAKLRIEWCKNNKTPHLDLGNCDITDLNDIPELFECTHIETLILSSSWFNMPGGNREVSQNRGYANVITRIPLEITKLQQLTKIIANGIAPKSGIANFIEKIISPTSKYVAPNGFRYLESLTNLKYLDLSNNGISDANFLEDVTKLEYLNLSVNQIRDAYYLRRLNNLRCLLLDNNKISDVSFLQKQYLLEKIELHNNQITEINSLKKFTYLRDLDLSNNDITDIKFLEGLSLQRLLLNKNKISDISPLKDHTHLSVLNLSRNAISDAGSLAYNTRLKYLDLSFNKITDISFLEKSDNIELLYLNNNQISDLYPLKKFPNIKALDLRNNNIKNIPRAIFSFPLSIYVDESEYIDANYYGAVRLRGNTIKSPPVEIIRQGRKSVLNWFNATKRKLNEIKVILIGDPKAGKTSLLRRFKDDTFYKDEVQTDGINIESIHFGESGTFINQTALHHLTAHFWDFGGQEIMNSTHQFFLTNRSVYILVLDARKDDNITGLIRQWLKRIRATGGNSPVIVVANQIDVNTGFGFSNEVELMQEFSQIKYFVKTSCFSGKGLNELKQKLEELIPKAELFNTEIDERWIRIKEQLQKETKSKHFLDEERFMEVCNINNLNNKDARKNAINFLHDLGLVLHFEDLNLSEYYVLDPYWITYGVYQILTSTYAGQEKGIVEVDKLKYIVNEEENKKEAYQPANYRKIIYTPNQLLFLGNILNQFKLCFYLPDHKRFIIPNLLDTAEPVEITDSIRNAQDSIRFSYKYEYLSHSIMPYIMVEANKIIDNMWRTGCVLRGNGCVALVSCYENILSIIVTGEHRKKREFMAVIRHLVDIINRTLSDKPKMLIPLPDINASADYEVLLSRERRGKKYYIHDEDKPTEKEFEISVLLEGIPGQDEMSEIRQQLSRILAGNEAIVTGVRNIDNKLDGLQYAIKLSNDSLDKILEAVAELTPEQQIGIAGDMKLFITECFKQSNREIDDKLQKVYSDLKETDNVEMQLKLSIPLLNLLGIDIGFDVKGWAQKMYRKYPLKVISLLNVLPKS